MPALDREGIGPARAFRVPGGHDGGSDDDPRAIPVGALAPLLRLPVSWVALQFADVARALDPRLPNLTTLGVTDFADTARVLLELDAVVTIDTAVAHLAGTLGRPTRLLLVHPEHPNSDGRWYERAPLYPAVRVTRQVRVGEWAGAIEAARDALCRCSLALDSGDLSH